MIKTPLAFVAAMALTSTAGAVEYTTVLPERSQVTFTSKQMGVATEGRFKRFDAALSFDPAKPEAGKAQVEVDVASIDAGSKDANDEVAGKGWFNSKEFPKAKFVADSIKSLAPGKYEARGKLTIKGKTKDVVVPFSYKADGAGVNAVGVFEGSIPLVRSQFGIGEGAWADTSVVADDVPVKFRLTAAPGTPAKK